MNLPRSAPLVSVLLPVFNAASRIRAALGSLQDQTLADWEAVVIDDGSTDETGPTVRELARADRRIRLVSRPHAGLVPALEAGREAARAPLLARLDADDLSHRERLAEQVEYLAGHGEAGLVGCLVEFGGDPVRARGYAMHVDWMNTVRTPEQIALGRFIESPFAHPSVMFRSQLARRLGGYAQGDFPEDYELWLRWLDAGVIMAKVPEYLLTWNDPEERLSRHDPRYRFEAFYRCKAVYLARWLRRTASRPRRFLVWGAGRLTRRRSDFLIAQGIPVAGYIDIDPRKIGRSYAAGPVLAPEDIPSPEECFVIAYVAKRGARELAGAHLRARGFVEGRDYIHAA